MGTNKINLLDDKINCESPDFRELIAVMRQTTQIAEKVAFQLEPSLFNERYLTTNEIMTLFRISRRTLQSYRDNGIFPYIQIGKIILYAESKIQKALEKNYYKPII